MEVSDDIFYINGIKGEIFAKFDFRKFRLFFNIYISALFYAMPMSITLSRLNFAHVLQIYYILNI